MTFATQRREPLLDEASYQWNATYTLTRLLPQLIAEENEPSQELADRQETRWRIAHEEFQHALRLFSAGEKLPDVAAFLNKAIADFDYFGEFIQDGADWPQLDLAIQTYYVDALWLLSLTVLLKLGDKSVEDVSNLYAADETNDGADELFESLLAKVGRKSYPSEGLIHEDPYQLLLDCIKAEPQDRPALMTQFLKRWFKGLKECDWWGSHINRTKDAVLKTGFSGYWAFEAALVTYLWDIDDISYRDLPHYPKDLVDYARSHALPAQGKPSPARVPAGQPCPRTGFWFTPARLDSRRQFTQGEVMPDVGGDYGATIWQWDTRQD